MPIVIFALACILAIYAASSIKSKRDKEKRIKARMERDRTVRAVNRMSEVLLKRISQNLSDTKADGCVEGLKAILAEKGISPEKLNRTAVRELLNDLAKQYASPKLYAPITEKYGSLLIDYVYENLQISFETGPAYNKFKKALDKKMSSVSKKDIEKYLGENYKGNFDAKMANDIKKNFASGVAKSMSDNIKNRTQSDMQQQMQLDLQNQMQQQMQLDMQNQLMMQMQMDMQQQMMTDMQNQMQQQMMTDMQNQMQHSQMELANTMHHGEMAITPMHDGGHMNDMNNMHMGGL